MLRPADAQETLEAWKMAMDSKDHPVCIVLTRQDIQGFEKEDADWKKNIRNGAYIAKKGGDTPDITILATGSEVSMAVQAAEMKAGKNIRVVSILAVQSALCVQKQESAQTGSSLQQVKMICSA